MFDVYVSKKKHHIPSKKIFHLQIEVDALDAGLHALSKRDDATVHVSAERFGAALKEQTK